MATHNHFVLDRGGKVFKQTAPVIKLPEGATEDEHLALLGVLNSSTACFWLKQVCHDKGMRGEGGGFTPSDWERFYRVQRHRHCRTIRCRVFCRWSEGGRSMRWRRNWPCAHRLRSVLAKRQLLIHLDAARVGV